jgi:hypothetical protein
MGNERPRYWFPLALLGFAQLVVVVFSLGADRSGGWFAYAPYAERGYSGYVGLYGVEMSSANAIALDASFDLSRNDGWLFAVLAVYLGTVIWYAVRARRAGNGMRWWKVLAIALGGLIGIALADLVGYWELKMDGDARSAVLLTLGLVLLAWLERSALVLVVAALFVLCAVVLTQGLQALLLSSVVALAGAFAALLRRPKAAAEES